MNRKVWVVGALLLALGWGAKALACAAHAKENAKSAGGCPMHVAGAKVSVVKIDSGVVIHITGGDAATVANIQAAGANASAGAASGKAGCKDCAGHGAAKQEAGKAASAAKAGVYACAMGDYSGPMTKDGRCPKCGMALSLTK